MIKNPYARTEWSNLDPCKLQLWLDSCKLWLLIASAGKPISEFGSYYSSPAQRNSYRSVEWLIIAASPTWLDGSCKVEPLYCFARYLWFHCFLFRSIDTQHCHLLDWSRYTKLDTTRPIDQDQHCVVTPNHRIAICNNHPFFIPSLVMNTVDCPMRDTTLWHSIQMA